MKIILTLVVSSLFLVSCGFHMLHDIGDSNSKLSSITLEDIEAEKDYLLRRYVEDYMFLNTSRKKTIGLSIKVNKSKKYSVIKQDNAVSGQDLMVVAKYSLKDLKTNKVIKKGFVRVIASVNVLISPFASEANLDKAYSDALKEIARILKINISIDLKDHENSYK